MSGMTRTFYKITSRILPIQFKENNIAIKYNINVSDYEIHILKKRHTYGIIKIMHRK
jgi:hypothetical protein